MPTQMLVLFYSSCIVLELYGNDLSLPHRFLDGNRLTVLHRNVFRSLGHLQKLLVKSSDLCWCVGNIFCEGLCRTRLMFGEDNHVWRWSIVVGCAHICLPVEARINSTAWNKGKHLGWLTQVLQLMLTIVKWETVFFSLLGRQPEKRLYVSWKHNFKQWLCPLVCCLWVAL